jgi:hypothetical protein
MKIVDRGNQAAMASRDAELPLPAKVLTPDERRKAGCRKGGIVASCRAGRDVLRARGQMGGRARWAKVRAQARTVAALQYMARHLARNKEIAEQWRQARRAAGQLIGAGSLPRAGATLRQCGRGRPRDVRAQAGPRRARLFRRADVGFAAALGVVADRGFVADGRLSGFQFHARLATVRELDAGGSEGAPKRLDCGLVRREVICAGDPLPASRSR